MSFAAAPARGETTVKSPECKSTAAFVGEEGVGEEKFAYVEGDLSDGWHVLAKEAGGELKGELGGID